MITIQIKTDDYRINGEWEDMLDVDSAAEAAQVIRHLRATDNAHRAEGLIGRFERTTYRIKPEEKAKQVIRCIRR